MSELNDAVRAGRAEARRELLRPYVAAYLWDSTPWDASPVAFIAEVDRILSEATDEEVAAELRGISESLAKRDTCCPECGREYDE